MEKVIVVATYEAYVPKDADMSQIIEHVENKIRSDFEDFRITEIKTENEEDNAREPWFILDDVMVGTSVSISVGN